MHEPTLELPILLENLTPEEVTWLAAKSSKTGLSTAEVVREILTAASTPKLEGGEA
jgi:phage FluMu gp28-like protein